jgi:hypothetical protein
MVFLFGLFPRFAAATETTWTATGFSAIWGDAANWSAGVPDIATGAVIANGGTPRVESSFGGPASAVAQSVTVSRGILRVTSGSTLDLGPLAVTGGLADGGFARLDVFDDSAVTAGAVTLGGHGDLFAASANLNDSASFTATSVTLRATGYPAGLGGRSSLEFQVLDNASFQAGALTLQADLTAGSEAAIFRVASAHAAVTGNVSLIGADNKNTKTTEIRIDSLGSTTGQLTVGGNFSITGSGSFFLGLPSNSAAAPAIDIGGILDLGSLSSSPFTVDLQSSNYSGIPEGYSWTFLTADGGITGNLDGLVLGYAGNDPKWHLVKDSTSLSLVYSSVPEPTPIALVLGGLLAIGLLYRGKRITERR